MKHRRPFVLTAARAGARVALLCAVTLLAACASGPQVIDAQVRSVSAQPPGDAVLRSGLRYRFTPLPPQPGQPDPQRLLAQAEAALAQVGAVRDDAQPQVAVTVSGHVRVTYADFVYGEPSNTRLSLGLGFGRGWHGGGIGLGWGAPFPWVDPVAPIYISEASLLMHDLRSGQIVYDTRARHEGLSHNTDAVLAALFVAALQGFPHPSATRQVRVQALPPAPQPAPAAAR